MKLEISIKTFVAAQVALRTQIYSWTEKKNKAEQKDRNNAAIIKEIKKCEHNVREYTAAVNEMQHSMMQPTAFDQIELDLSEKSLAADQ